MKQLLLFAMLMGGILTACAQKENDENVNQTQNDQTTMDKMNITIDGVTHTATFADTPAAKALAEKLKDGDFNLTLNTNGDFEIWGDLCPLPATNEQYSAQPGDIVLYREQYICLLYGPYTYSYTRLGRIEGNLSESELRTFLKAGQWNVKVKLSLVKDATGISQVKTSTKQDILYSMNGQRVANPSHGIYIENGKKVVK